MSIYLNFKTQQTMLEYHPSWQMMHEALEGVHRFLGNDQIPADKKQTTRAHVENVLEGGYDIFRATEKQLGKGLFSASKAFTHCALAHDWGEVVIEPMLAYGEMDPETQKALAQYPTADIEGQIASHFYRYAVVTSQNEPSKRFPGFSEYVAQAREACVPKSHASGKMQTADVLHFYQQITFLMKHTHDAMSYLSPHWSSEQTNRQVSVMERHYNDIEHQGSFIGTWAKVLEKMDGTAYACAVRQETGQIGTDPRFENRILGRYEGCFHSLLTKAGKKTAYQLLATNLILKAYEASLQTMQQHRGTILLDGMDQTITCDEATQIYADRLDELRGETSLILTPDQFAPKETLLQRHCRAA